MDHFPIRNCSAALHTNVCIKHFRSIGTTDMAAWHILIELNNHFRLHEFKAEFINNKR